MTRRGEPRISPGLSSTTIVTVFEPDVTFKGVFTSLVLEFDLSRQVAPNASSTPRSTITDAPIKPLPIAPMTSSR